MNRILLLLLVAGATYLLVVLAVKPELIGNVWLWFVGLSGLIVRVFQLLTNYVKKLFSTENN